MPKLGETMTEGTIVRWLVAEGDNIAQDDPLLLIETDKVELEIPSPSAGRLVEIIYGDGKSCPVGTVIGIIGE